MTYRFRRLCLTAVSAVALTCAAASVHAETLAEAMALAYESNPTLQSQRALQRQTDETYVQARAGWRLTANGTVTGSYQNQQSTVSNNVVNLNRLNSQVSISQPVFTSGRISALVDAADATVRAGRETLRLVEAQVLQQVIQAYQDVLRDQQILAIRQQSVDVLSQQLYETQERFEAGLVTRTDTARAEANLAQSRAQLTTARANLQNSRAAYATVVGRPPGELVTPAVLPGLPPSFDEAIDEAEERNPTLRRAKITEEGSRARIAQIRAGRGPTVSLNGNVGYSGTADPFGPFNRNVSVSAVASIPIFTGGVLSSQIRAATAQNTSDRILIEQNRRAVVQTLTTAWNQMLSAQGNILSTTQQVQAATVAFEGSQEQFRVGLATTLDTLLAQEALRSAQLALVQARRDLYVAQAQVLNSAGGLEMIALADNAPYYDPLDNFEQVRDAGALPWDGLIQLIDLDARTERVRTGAAPEVFEPAGDPVLKPGQAPAVLDDAEAALVQVAPTRGNTPPAGSVP